MAKILGIATAQTSNDTTVYDPTCGSGSLLLKVGATASAKVTLYGQEKDAATSGLARMNMILHDNPTALVRQGNTLTTPLFTDAAGHQAPGPQVRNDLFQQLPTVGRLRRRVADSVELYVDRQRNHWTHVVASQSPNRVRA